MPATPWAHHTALGSPSTQSHAPTWTPRRHAPDKRSTSVLHTELSQHLCPQSPTCDTWP